MRLIVTKDEVTLRECRPGLFITDWFGNGIVLCMKRVVDNKSISAFNVLTGKELELPSDYDFYDLYNKKVNLVALLMEDSKYEEEDS